MASPLLLLAPIESRAIRPLNGLKPEADWTRQQGKRRRRRRRGSRIAAMDADLVVSTTAVTQQAVTWEIAVGAIAGGTPFLVAGIEFSKRIIAQRRCELCDGSGLILMDNDDDDKKEYCRCPGCGGFLPWQSWKRFFTG